MLDRLLVVLRLAALDFAGQVAALLGGLALLAGAIHLVERRASRRLAHRFGWRSVLVTGWIGVPLHELSHLAACFIFQHRIVAFSLFDPDPRTGTLGYVQHAFRQRNLYQLAGNFFIGIAPLLGGAVVLLGALWLLLPAAWPSLTAGPEAASLPAQLGHTAQVAGQTLSAIFSSAHLASWQLWVFLVLALCVGTHLSPSRPDLHGALPGLGLLLLALFSVAALNRWFLWWRPDGWVLLAARVLSPLLAVLAVALVLELAFWLVVEAVVRLTMPRRSVRLGYEGS